jgi:hypothetical protein
MTGKTHFYGGAQAHCLICTAALFLCSTAAFSLGEDVLQFGGAAGWKHFTGRSNLLEFERVRPHKVIALNSAEESRDASLNMYLSFDEETPDRFIDSTGNYSVEISNALNKAGPAWSRFGTGAAVFPGSLNISAFNNTAEPVMVIKPRKPNALFFDGNAIGGFSIEFWLCPAGMGNGEEVLSWTASIPNGGTMSQQIQNFTCSISKNRFEWNFKDFFFAPHSFSEADAEKSYAKSVNLRLSASTVLTPKSWSRHLLRFNAETGLLEYLVNGVLEDIAYATASGSEDGDVFLPVAGERGIFVLGRHFDGIIDNFRVYDRFVEQGSLHRYVQNGRLQSAPIDLGAENAAVLRVDASGGVYNTFSRKIQNNPDYSSGFDFPDGGAIRFFIRSSASPYLWDNSGWQLFTPGTAMNTVGRYIELAAEFYPGADFETTPYLETVNIVFAKKSPPEPPAFIKAEAEDGGVKLSWKPSKDETAKGYLVYYGLATGDYFGEGASLGPSPIDVGSRLSLNIDNLRNGTLYYFSVSSYDSSGAPGNFSRETFARPVGAYGSER